jgi:AcrR family transcriptional regulator
MTDQSVKMANSMAKTGKTSGKADSGEGRLKAASSRAGHAAKPLPRAVRSAERREAILEAALEEFSASGYAATRLDDVARRADVAKGTIYLHFADKESLFQELLRTMMSPVLGAIAATPDARLPMRAIAERFVETFVHEIYNTRRRDVIRLMLTEGHRFPELAEFYYREVLSKALGGVRSVLGRAAEPGNARHAALVEFPQLLVAPGLVAILWSGLFERFSPLDIQGLMRAHLDLLFGADGGRPA